MSDFLFGLPTWVVIILVLFTCVCLFSVWVLCAAADLGDMQARSDRADQRMRDLNHQDVAERAGSREWLWDADDDLPA